MSLSLSTQGGGSANNWPAEVSVTKEAGLLPCPFCGGEAHDSGHVSYSRPVDDTWWADGSPVQEAFFCSCVKCGARARGGIIGGHQTKSEAITAWNTRTPASEAVPDDVRALVIAAREFWDIHNDLSVESKALDKALEPFASRVRFDDEPEGVEIPAEGGA